MSVSQVKKRFAEFESYLRNDKEGLRRLKLLKDDVNVLRTSLAAAVEAKELAETIKDAARERADKTETQAAEAAMENERLRSVVSSLEARVRLNESQKHITIVGCEDDIENEDSSNAAETADGGEAKRVMKVLRRSLPQCPKLTSKQSSRHCPSFLRQGFSKGWSHSDMWILGASVAIIAAHEGAVTIVDPVGTEFGVGPRGVTKGMVGGFIRWFGKNFKKREGPPKRVYFGDKEPAQLADPSGG
jgi:hypothetical protein